MTPLLYQSLLATIMGRHPKPIQKNGDLGILFLQISTSRLPIWPSFSRLPSTLWWRIQINSWKIIAWLVNGGAIVYYDFTDFKVETICFSSSIPAHWQTTEQRNGAHCVLTSVILKFSRLPMMIWQKNLIVLCSKFL